MWDFAGDALAIIVCILFFVFGGDFGRGEVKQNSIRFFLLLFLCFCFSTTH